ncbi:4Fe-4S dicluster domain-containing protein [Ihubacter sp. rT4E-8]|uniref:4Fe-4S dicluster domain-containing protein n=1 Tax=unclassified Ihubacter TaxID=2633299 RepID=UPI003C7CB6A9
MMERKKLRRYAQVAYSQCVACGCCVKVCPKAAIRIEKGKYAVIDVSSCIGCGKCSKECPASVIELQEVE